MLAGSPTPDTALPEEPPWQAEEPAQSAAPWIVTPAPRRPDFTAQELVAMARVLGQPGVDAVRRTIALRVSLAAVRIGRTRGRLPGRMCLRWLRRPLSACRGKDSKWLVKCSPGGVYVRAPRRATLLRADSCAFLPHRSGLGYPG